MVKLVVVPSAQISSDISRTTEPFLTATRADNIRIEAEKLRKYAKVSSLKVSRPDEAEPECRDPVRANRAKCTPSTSNAECKNDTGAKIF